MTIDANSLSRTPALKKHIQAALFLFFLCCIAYWPLTFHVFSLKNDALNYFLPVRLQVSEAIHNGHYPFWSPYFNLGYPLHGDMQSGVWNPIVQLISLFGPYTLYTLQLETLFYIFMAGLGMYWLLCSFTKYGYVALFGASAYMLCGFNSDCCQYLNWISSAAWCPFVIHFFCRTLQQKKVADSLATGFFLYLMFSTAYPAHFIVLIYLLLGIFIHYLVIHKKIVSTLITLTPTLICFVLLSLPAILSYAQYLPLTERGDGASYADAMSNPLHPSLLSAYFTPLPIHAIPYAEVTDNLERNSYFGIITLAFTIAAFFIKTDNPDIRFARIATIVFQIMSLGEYGLLRPLTYYVLPLMNAFRHPAGLKIFTIFFACILATWSMDGFIAGKGIPAIKRSLLFSTSVVILLAIISIPAISTLAHIVRQIFHTAGSHGGTTSGIPALKNLLSDINVNELILFDAFIQLCFLIPLLLYAFPQKKHKTIIGFSILNLAIHTCMFLPFTVVKKDRASYIQQIVDQNTTRNYPLPSLDVSLRENSARDSSYFLEIGDLNMYNKLVGRNDYRISPSNLTSQNNFWFDIHLRRRIMRYPLIYRPDTVVSAIGVPLSGTGFPDIDTAKKIVLADSGIQIEALHITPPDIGDRIAVTKFTPGHIQLNISTRQKAFFVLLQNRSPLWKMKIDGQEQPITPVNRSFMGFNTPAGTHTISFEYAPAGIIFALWLNVILTSTLLSLGLWRLLRRRPIIA